MKPIPVCRVKCPTCPFRAGSRYASLAPTLALSALSETSRICHSTGSGNAINYRTGKARKLCRGARDQQLQFFHAIGFLKSPTDAAWNAMVKLKTRPPKPAK